MMTWEEAASKLRELLADAQRADSVFYFADLGPVEDIAAALEAGIEALEEDGEQIEALAELVAHLRDEEAVR